MPADTSVCLARPNLIERRPIAAAVHVDGGGSPPRQTLSSAKTARTAFSRFLLFSSSTSVVSKTPIRDGRHSWEAPSPLVSYLSSWMIQLIETREGVMTDHLNAASSHYPYTAVVEVVATFKDGTSEQGSGVMVSPNDVLTASHMLWDVDHGGAATSVTIYAGRDGGSTPFGCGECVAVVLFSGRRQR